MGFSERPAQAMKNAGYTQGRLAKDVGMAQSSVNKLLKDANGSRKTVEIASVLGVRPEWLSAGEGEMLASGMQEPYKPYQVKAPENGFYRVDVLDVKASAGPVRWSPVTLLKPYVPLNTQLNRLALCLATGHHSTLK